MFEITTTSAEQTKALGRRVAQALPSGALVALYGDIGAGKTAFVQGMALYLGIKENVTSPTFTLVKEYSSLCHLDIYRIGDESELFEIGFDEYLDGDRMMAIEWAERIQDCLPEKRVDIKLTRVEQDIRSINIWGYYEKQVKEALDESPLY